MTPWDDPRPSFTTKKCQPGACRARLAWQSPQPFRGHLARKTGAWPHNLKRSDALLASGSDQQLWREHRVTILAALALLDAQHHALAVDIRDF